jgi:hypothetical protein
MLRFRTASCIVIFALTACNNSGTSLPSFGTSPTLASRANDDLELQTCERRDNDTFAKLEPCIERHSLWQHLARFQSIADANPGPLGHGNRDTGTPGYKASVDYVAGLMRAAGYGVTVQQYVYGNREPDGTPAFTVPGANYTYDEDWFIARNSGEGDVAARVVPPAGATDGCARGDFRGFTGGNIALLAKSGCDVNTQVAAATAAGAAAVILYDDRSAPEAQATRRG